MRFWQRLGTTVRADAHGVIDGLEDQGLLLKQHLRDAELELQAKKGRLAALAAEQERLDQQRAALARDRARHDRDAELALQEGADDLARYALKQLLARDTLGERIDARRLLLGKEQQALSATLIEQEAAFSDLSARAEAFLAQRRSAPDGSVLEARPVTAEQVELELLRRKTARRDARPQEDEHGQ